MSEPKAYVRVDEQGAWRVGQTRVPLESVVIAFQEGQSPDAIREQYPALSLEEVHGAIAYYLANREVVQRYLDEVQKLWDEWRQKVSHTPSPVVERLRAMRASPNRERQ
jgi:uncharacterized protein (DUF433 family)